MDVSGEWAVFAVLVFLQALRAGISSRYHQESFPGGDHTWIAPSPPIMPDTAAFTATLSIYGMSSP